MSAPSEKNESVSNDLLRFMAILFAMALMFGVGYSVGNDREPNRSQDAFIREKRDELERRFRACYDEMKNPGSLRADAGAILAGTFGLQATVGPENTRIWALIDLGRCRGMAELWWDKDFLPGGPLAR